MSSAISTKGSRGRAAAAAADAVGADAVVADTGFRPWHFFLLAALAASTAAVLMSRRPAPEHLILLSFTIGAAGLAAAAFYRTLAPLAVRDVSVLGTRPSERARAATEREKALVLRSIKELEFDRAMGKVSAKDFDEMAGRLRARAIMLMKQLDAGGSGYRELIERELQARLRRRGGADGAEAVSSKPDTTHREDMVGAPAPDVPDEFPREATRARQIQICSGCETANDHDAAFCKRCGTPLQVMTS